MLLLISITVANNAMRRDNQVNLFYEDYYTNFRNSRFILHNDFYNNTDKRVFLEVSSGLPVSYFLNFSDTLTTIRFTYYGPRTIELPGVLDVMIISGADDRGISTRVRIYELDISKAQRSSAYILLIIIPIWGYGTYVQIKRRQHIKLSRTITS